MANPSPSRKWPKAPTWVALPVGLLAVSVALGYFALYFLEGSVYLRNGTAFETLRCLVPPAFVAFAAIVIARRRVTLILGVVSAGLFTCSLFDLFGTYIIHNATSRMGANVVHIQLDRDDRRIQSYYLYVCDGTGWLCSKGLVCRSGPNNDDTRATLLIDESRSEIKVLIDDRVVYRQDATRGIFEAASGLCFDRPLPDREPLVHSP